VAGFGWTMGLKRALVRVWGMCRSFDRRGFPFRYFYNYKIHKGAEIGLWVRLLREGAGTRISEEIAGN
jgi:hypothetical protein